MSYPKRTRMTLATPADVAHVFVRQEYRERAGGEPLWFRDIHANYLRWVGEHAVPERLQFGRWFFYSWLRRRWPCYQRGGKFWYLRALEPRSA